MLDDNMLFLILACFLAKYNISLHVLSRGATPRKRWTKNGEIYKAESGSLKLAAELEHFLLDVSRLGRAVADL
jgi:hypothetical protein